MADRDGVITGPQLPAEQPFPPASQMTTPMPVHTPGPLVVGYYVPSEAFRRIPEHVAAMRASDQTVVALFGPASDDAEADAQLFIAASRLLDSLLAVEWAGSIDDEFGDEVDACPNCAAPVGEHEIFDGRHFTGCELRDSLDAALGVKSPRIERAQ